MSDAAPSGDRINASDTVAGRFLFEIDGSEIGWFEEVSGLEFEIEVFEINEGGNNEFPHQLPGRVKWPRLTLKRGVTQNNELFEWLESVSGEGYDGDLDRRTAAITLVGNDGTRLRAWEFIDAIPVKWSGPSFSVSSTDAPVESLEIAHHGFRATDV